MFATPPAGRPRAINRHNQQLFDQLFGAQQNLTLDSKRALKILLSANKQLNTRLCSQGKFWPSCGAMNARARARRFFENWRAGLKWQRLKSYEKFAEMNDRHLRSLRLRLFLVLPLAGTL
jgi:hypothetical protein